MGQKMLRDARGHVQFKQGHQPTLYTGVRVGGGGSILDVLGSVVGFREAAM